MCEHVLRDGGGRVARNKMLDNLIYAGHAVASGADAAVMVRSTRPNLARRGREPSAQPAGKFKV